MFSKRVKNVYVDIIIKNGLKINCKEFEGIKMILQRYIENDFMQIDIITSIRNIYDVKLFCSVTALILMVMSKINPTLIENSLLYTANEVFKG